MKNKFITLGAIMLGLILWAPGTLAASFGISPPRITNDHLKPGSNFVYVIDISASGLQEEMIIHTEIEGDPEISQWLSVQNRDNLVLKRGENTTPVSVNVRIPTNAQVGEYHGNLKIYLAHNNGLQDNVAILLGASAEVDLNVIDYDVTDYYIQSISVDPIIEGQDLDLTLNIKNLGNTVIRNIKTYASISEVHTGAQAADASGEILSVPVYPQDMIKSKINLTGLDLKAGNYWLNVESFKGNEPVFKNKLYLTVKPPLTNNSLQTAVSVTKDGEIIRPAAPEYQQKLQTSVTVRAPLTNQLIMVIIGILLVITGIIAKFYVTFKKKRR